MKKLLFAIAGAASFAALAADPTPGANDIDVLGFENFDLTDTANVSGAVVERTDSGIGGTSKWSCSGDDASLVKTYGGDNAAKGNGLTFPGPFEDEGDQYLALDTNGSELQRAVGATVAADGTYIDTLVQFTPSESAPTAADLTDAKLAIWLGVDSEHNTTNLMVQGSSWDFDQAPTGASQAFALTGKTIEPGTWYRLTVKAIPNFMNEDSGLSIPAFQILVDGTEMTLATAPLSAGFLELLDQSSMYASADIKAAMTANKLVPSIQDEAGAYGATVTLTSVGFKGTGALDDFVVTTAAPDFTPAAIDFSLTWPAGLTAVSYQIGENEPVAISGASPFAVPGLAAGDVVKFIVANADGAQKTLTGTAGTDAGLDATGTTFTWADYLGDAVDGAYEIDNLAELKLFQKGVANTSELTTVSTTFKLTADITLDEAWPGIGIQNAKDLISYNSTDPSKSGYITPEVAAEREALFAAAAFKGTFDGQNHTISGFQMQGGGLDYAGFFNATMGATIKNFKIAYAGSLFATDTTASSAESGGTFVGVSVGTTNQNLTTVAGTVSCSKGFGGIVGYFARGSLIEYCTNNVNMTSLKPNKCGGIAMIAQNSPAVTMRNCQNNGTIAGSNETGALIGYIGLNTTVADCSSTVAHKLMHHQDNTVTIQGVITVADLTTTNSYTGAATPGLNFATVENGVATFVADGALAAGNTYKVMHVAAATFNFTAAGTIAFDTSLASPSSWAITAAEGLTLTDETVGTVKTYTAAGAGGDDYVVEIDNADVVITPQAGDLEALAEAGVDTNSVAAVNAALATTIEGTSIPAWQALFLGVAPTTNGLETVAIKSISIAADGTVTVEMADGVTLKTGRGVDIKLKLMGSTDLTNWTQIGSDITNTKVIPAITPAEGETKKFYKVVVDFAGSQN